jgi:cell division protein FtsW
MSDTAFDPRATPSDDAPLLDTSILGRWWRSVDQWTLWAVGLLFIVGLILGLAASPPLAARNDLPAFHYVIRQAAFGGMALAAMVVVSMASPRLVRRGAVLAFAAVFASVLLLPVLGTDFGKGATRWYSLGFTSVQPSEFLKPAFAVFAGWLLSASARENGPPGALMSLLLTLAVVASLVIQPDFGQASLVLATWIAMYFVAGAPLVLLGGVGLAGLGGAWVAYSLSAHVRRRIDAFLDPQIDPFTQMAYATDAILSGGLFGVGAGGGTVKWSLPDAHTDLIIAVAAEEYGVVLCLLIIALYVFIVVRAFGRLLAERDAFARLAGVGLTVLFGLQALINLGVAIRLFPPKGMTLPMISYGGSSMLAVGLGLGMLLALTRRRPRNEAIDLLGRG